ncbi:hypothetical protein V8D89_003832 [Ganoderma adspersum]
MGQLWEVINVDRREHLLAGGSKLGEFFFDDMSDLHKALQTPILPDLVDESLARGTMVFQPGSIGKLSTEVLDMIFQEILHDQKHPFVTNFVACTCFAIACKRLLTVGKRHILEGMIKYHVRAANCRLVCLGEYTDATDQAPPGMLTKEELKEIAGTNLVRVEDDDWAIAERNDSEEPEGNDSDPNLICERCLYDFAMEFYEPAPMGRRKHGYPLWWAGHAVWGELMGPETLLMERGDVAQLRDRELLETLTGWATYPPGPNVLLNLVKGEYVREAALIVRGKDFGRVSLAHAMLSRICYSLDPSVADEFCGEEFVGRFGRRPWAGDRFCVQKEDDMPVPEAECGFTEWVNVTAEVNRLLGNLWRETGWGEG